MATVNFSSGVNVGLVRTTMKKSFSPSSASSIRVSLLDETDSGLDIDALRIVSEGVNKFNAPHNAIVLVTHYDRILNYITPDFVHVLVDGNIVKSGGRELALELEEKGYEWLREEITA